MKNKSSKKNLDLSLFFKRFLLIALAVYICITLISQQGILSRTEKELEIVESQISEAQKQSKQLEDEKNLTSSNEYIERVARERLGFSKKTEKVFIDINK